MWSLVSAANRQSTGYMALQPQNKGKSWVFPMFHYHFCRAALFHEARPFTVNLCLTKDKTEANGNALFRVATLTEAQEYLTAAVEQGELLLDLTRKDTVRRESYTTRACSSTATRSTTPRTARLNFKRTQASAA